MISSQTVLTRRRITGRFATLAIVTSTAMIATLAFTGPSARAATADEDGFVASAEVADALQGVQGDLVKDALETPSTSLTPGTISSEAAPGTLLIDIPVAATTGVTVSVGDFSLGIDLPNADEARHGEPLADGGVAYPSDGSSANAVIPTTDGVQLLSVINDREASETYAYDLSLPAGHRLEATPDGGARILDEHNTVKVEFEPAWAQDAAGGSVPTHYTVRGNTLTQVVDHKDLSGVSYPIVADPLPVIVIVITAAALIVVAAAALGVATWIVVSWWNTCRAMGKYPELSTKNGFTARCVR